MPAVVFGTQRDSRGPDGDPAPRALMVKYWRQTSKQPITIGMCAM